MVSIPALNPITHQILSKSSNSFCEILQTNKQNNKTTNRSDYNISSADIMRTAVIGWGDDRKRAELTGLMKTRCAEKRRAGRPGEATPTQKILDLRDNGFVIRTVPARAPLHCLPTTERHQKKRFSSRLVSGGPDLGSVPEKDLLSLVKTWISVLWRHHSPTTCYVGIS